MNFEILVNIAAHETRGAVVADGQLQELFFERPRHRGLVGNIYKAKVQRVLPGMQAAFVDAGLDRTAFLHADDVLPRGADAKPALSQAGEVATPDIRRLLSSGDEIAVQVVKDPLGAKGARVTMLLSLPSRYLVFMPYGSGVGVSARILDDSERERLRADVLELSAGRAGGYIVRTAAMGAPPAELAADLVYLEQLWTQIRAAVRAQSAGSVLHADLSLPLRLLRDEMSTSVTRFVVDDAATFESLRCFAGQFMPEAQPRIELHAGQRPLFDLHSIEQEIIRALERRVSLKSGGYLVIDQTESMTTIDVNTGGFVGNHDLEDTIFRTNLEAAAVIARQLRLRNLGGIIIIDFIDMLDEQHREQVVAALRDALAADRAQTQVGTVSALGLVEMSRKRTRESLEHLLCRNCPSCEGRGFVRTGETIVHDLLREVLKQSRQFPGRELLLLAHQDVIELLLGEEAASLTDLAAKAGSRVRLQTEALYEVEQFDVVIT